MRSLSGFLVYGKEFSSESYVLNTLRLKPRKIQTIVYGKDISFGQRR